MWQRVGSVLVRREFTEQVILRESPTPLLFRPELLRYGEERHDRVALYIVRLHLVENLSGIGKSLRYIAEYLVHLLTCLEPFLLGIEHT